MKAYISKSNKANKNCLTILRKELTNFSIIEYMNGEYNDFPLKSSKVLIVLLNDTTGSIGRGQYNEITIANNTSIPTIAVYIKGTIIQVFEIIDMKKLHNNTWVDYAIIDLNFVTKLDLINPDEDVDLETIIKEVVKK